MKAAATVKSTLKFCIRRGSEALGVIFNSRIDIFLLGSIQEEHLFAPHTLVWHLVCS